MKKLFLVLIIVLANLLHASDTVEQKIYQKVLTAIFSGQTKIKVWCDSAKRCSILSTMQRVIIVPVKEEADILFISKMDEKVESDKKIFTDGYLVFRNYKEHIVGGFYWKKGRPNIVFVRKNLQKYHIHLPKDLEDYIE